MVKCRCLCLSCYTTFSFASEPKLRLGCTYRSAPLISFAGLSSGAFVSIRIYPSQANICDAFQVPLTWYLVFVVIFSGVIFGSYWIQAIWKAPNTLPMRAKCSGLLFGEANAVCTTFVRKGWFCYRLLCADL